AKEVSSRATCDRAHVGAVLVLNDRIISTGFNGSLPGQPHCDDEGHDLENGHCIRTIHAEENAIIQCARAGIRSIGADCVCTVQPCLKCTRILAAAGISRIFYDRQYSTMPPNDLE